MNSLHPAVGFFLVVGGLALGDLPAKTLEQERHQLQIAPALVERGDERLLDAGRDKLILLARKPEKLAELKELAEKHKATVKPVVNQLEIPLKKKGG